MSYKDYLGKSNKIRIQICIYHMEQIQCDHLSHFPVTYEQMREAIIPPFINDDIDVSIIISKTCVETSFSLIRMRYHNVKFTVTSQLSKDLLLDIKKILMVVMSVSGVVVLLD